MIDMVATARSLRQNRRNHLENMTNIKNHRALAFGAAALALLGGGWYAVQHIAGADAAPVAAARPAVPVNTITVQPQ